MQIINSPNSGEMGMREPVGQLMDVAVARDIMGLKVIKTDFDSPPTMLVEYGSYTVPGYYIDLDKLVEPERYAWAGCKYVDEVPKYSTDANAAEKVIEALSHKGYTVQITKHVSAYAVVVMNGDGKTVMSSDSTLAGTVSRAALLANLRWGNGDVRV